MDNQPQEQDRSDQQPARRRYDRYVTRPSTLAQRGYGCIALEKPNDEVNVGHALRAALCFEARLVIVGGAPPGLNVQRLKTDPGRAYRHVPVIQVDDIFDALPEDCTAVAIELTDDAVGLPTFVHPERACYIFGPENGSISPEVLSRCSATVKIPTVMSLNLGMTVNIVLYDRMAKGRQTGFGASQ
ncbi:MAG: TrmH family RNA methyltransferase [Chloroflexi bacterium]|nr:TrmH family RNA methyltransferase [Chloroflexota bacterium]MDA1298026.1 TrmH family RNA methyltransferase [Chloroflexota bacterium]